MRLVRSLVLFTGKEADAVANQGSAGDQLESGSSEIKDGKRNDRNGLAGEVPSQGVKPVRRVWMGLHLKV